MKMVEIIRKPCVLCPKTGRIALVSECESGECGHFYGFNLGETRIGCRYGEGT
jgi:hypothetical protein